jgi:hypothetical protein
MGQVAECLPSKCRVLSSNCSIAKKFNKKHINNVYFAEYSLKETAQNLLLNEDGSVGTGLPPHGLYLLAQQ